MDIRAELRGYLERNEPRAFAWGCHDCFTFTADWVALVSGFKSPADEYRYRYKTPRGALIHIGRRGGASVSDIPDLVYPTFEISKAYASAGDIVCVTDPEQGAALGICDGRYGVFLKSGGGYMRRKHSEIERAWRVACQH